MKLILPGDPLFDVTLATARPPGWEETASRNDGNFFFVARTGGGVLEPVSVTEANEYLEEEYDERLEEIEEMEAYWDAVYGYITPDAPHE